jgi:hypothetical protein
MILMSFSLEPNLDSKSSLIMSIAFGRQDYRVKLKIKITLIQR